MYEILDALPNKSLVLDLGAGAGSFPHENYSFATIHLDVCKENLGTKGNSVQALGEQLPFRSSSFDAVILSHVLEHCAQPKAVLQEVGRVLKKSGSAYIAIPDGRTFSDRLYRKLFRNRGGHVSLFDSELKLRKQAEWFLGLPHAASRVLYSSFSYLNARNLRNPARRRELRVPPLSESAVIALSAAVCLWDRFFRTGLSSYGWCIYLGHIHQPIPTEPNPNVCVRCGCAEEVASSSTLAYHCSECGCWNINRRRLLALKAPSRPA
jgi:SAM-dependent methyltransferase